MKAAKIISVLMAAVMCLCMVTVAPAEGSYYEEQLKKYEAMKNRTIRVRCVNDGMFALKAQKFYYRQVLGLSYDGAFQISGWKCINDPSEEFVLPGTCVIFGYSADVLLETDWPYSGCFWGWDKQDTPVNDIYVHLTGFCRVVSVYIRINGNIVVREDNCPSHSEWKPC